MKELPFFTCCIKEAIRIHSPVPFIGRQTTKDIELEDGRIIPAGINMDIVIYDIHHNPHVWGEDHDVRIAVGRSWSILLWRGIMYENCRE